MNRMPATSPAPNGRPRRPSTGGNRRRAKSQAIKATPVTATATAHANQFCPRLAALRAVQIAARAARRRTNCTSASGNISMRALSTWSLHAAPLLQGFLPFLDNPPRVSRLLCLVHVLREVAQRDYLEAVVVQVLHVLLEPLRRRVHPGMLDVRSTVELE